MDNTDLQLEASNFNLCVSPLYWMSYSSLGKLLMFFASYYVLDTLSMQLKNLNKFYGFYFLSEFMYCPYLEKQFFKITDPMFAVAHKLKIIISISLLQLNTQSKRLLFT